VDTAELDTQGKFKRKTLTKFIAPAAGPGKVLKKRAQKLFYEEHLQDLHKTGPLSSRTVAEFVAEIFKPQVVLRCKPTGQAHYNGMLKNHVLPTLGEFMMRDVRPQHVYNLIKAKLDWRGEKGERLSVQTITHIRNCVSAVFRHAKRMQAYSGDLPTEGVRLPRLEHAEKLALSWNQVQAIAAVIGYPDPKQERKATRGPEPDPKKHNLQLGALVRVLALTGLRIGEAMGLRWKHVDLETGILLVRDNFVRGAYGTLKTAKSRRDIPLHSIAIAELRKLGPSKPESPVFAGRESGKPLDQHNVASRFLKGAGKRAGVPWVSWHILRHTATTLADQVGLSVAERQRMLGHSAGSMTLHYTHADLDMVRERMEKIGKVN
jgi:integrase